MLQEFVKIIIKLIIDWLSFKNRGHAQPDQDQRNFPIITNAEDASSQKQIDRT